MDKKFGIRSIFSLFLISYLIVLIVPALLAGYLYGQSLTMSRERYIEGEQERLARSVAYFERHLEQLDSTVLKLAYDRDLQQILQMEKPAPGDRQVMRVVRFNERVRDILSIGQDSSYALILKGNEFVFTNTSVIYGIYFFYDNTRHYGGMSAPEWITASFSTSKRDFLPMQQILWMNEPVKALTYNHPVYGYERQIVGTVQYLITEEELASFFQEPLEDQGQVRLYGSDGELLAALGSASCETDVSSLANFERGYNETENTVTLYQRSEEGLLFTLSRPKEVAFADAYRLGRLGWMGAFLCVVLELGLGVFFAWRYSRPIRHVLLNLRQMPGTRWKGRQNEYRQLASGVRSLIQENHSMQDVLRDQKEREKRGVIDQLLKGNFPGEKEAAEAVFRAGIPMGGAKHCILVWEADKELVSARMEQGAPPSIGWLYDEMPGRYIMMGEIGDEEDRQELRRWLEETGEGSAGIGKAYERLQDLGFSYQQALYSLKQARRQGREVLCYEELSLSQQMYYPEELRYKLVQGVSHGEAGVVEEVFCALYKENVEKHLLSGALCKILQSHLAAAYMEIWQEGILPEQNTPEQLLEPFVSTEEMLMKMKGRFLALCEETGRVKQDQKSDSRKRLIDYLEGHFDDEQLGVGMMAEAFGFSESYFSQFFRETTGEAFSTCLERIRMDRAKKYLKQGEMEVEAIARACGYTNAGSFRRAFKRVHGISPSTWKQENR